MKPADEQLSPRDIDEFRLELARKLDRLVQAEAEALPPGEAEHREMVSVGSDLEDISHRHQTPPVLAPDGNPWHTWLMIGGRGAGKTRAGAEWVSAQALGLPPYATEKASRSRWSAKPSTTCAR